MDVAADTSSVELGSLDDARELEALEAEEAQISAERRRLHERIDRGFATSAARVREREVSDHRRELHRRIDALRERLGLPVGPRWAAPESAPGEKIGDGTSRELAAIADPLGEPAPEFASDSERLGR
jgi:hypothetical protein